MKKVYFVDFDGTITHRDTCYDMVARFARPGWEEWENRWLKGEITILMWFSPRAACLPIAGSRTFPVFHLRVLRTSFGMNSLSLPRSPAPVIPIDVRANPGSPYLVAVWVLGLRCQQARERQIVIQIQLVFLLQLILNPLMVCDGWCYNDGER